MGTLAPAFLFVMTMVFFMSHHILLIKQAAALFDANGPCPSKIWEYREAPTNNCLPPRTDHGFWGGKGWQAAPAICWLLRHTSLLPPSSVFHPDLDKPTRAYRCRLP